MIHCQNCTTRNSLDREFCWKCGAKLFVPSGTAAFESAVSGIDEHVLERISALEYTINVLSKRLDMLTETVERVAANNFVDHTMIETLTDSLESAGINLKNLEAEWRRRLDSRILETEAMDRLGERVHRILDCYRGPNRKQFAMWIEKSYDLLVADHAHESLHFLRPAYEHDPGNAELGLLIGEVYFQNREYTNARECITHVLAAKPENFEATFLMGLIEHRKGNLKEARARLETAVGLKQESSAAHASLGSLLAEIGNNRQALKHLATALKLKPSAPVHFLMGAVCYGAGQHKRAIQHLRQATKLDPQFGEAHYQLGLLCLEMNWLRKAQQCFKTAQALNPRESRYRKRVRSFSKDATGPDQLNTLIREELLLLKCQSGAKRAK
jgi:tetratricopeptide (TPR) repeat protein